MTQGYHFGITESYVNAVYLCDGRSGNTYLHRADVDFAEVQKGFTLEICARCEILVAAALAAGCELNGAGQFKIDPRPTLRDLGYDV